MHISICKICKICQENQIAYSAYYCILFCILLFIFCILFCIFCILLHILIICFHILHIAAYFSGLHCRAESVCLVCGVSRSFNVFSQYTGGRPEPCLCSSSSVTDKLYWSSSNSSRAVPARPVVAMPSLLSVFEVLTSSRQPSSLSLADVEDLEFL